jgi:hypothetical protein
MHPYTCLAAGRRFFAHILFRRMASGLREAAARGHPYRAPLSSECSRLRSLASNHATEGEEAATGVGWSISHPNKVNPAPPQHRPEIETIRAENGTPNTQKLWFVEV